jgi:hypothetical protein
MARQQHTRRDARRLRYVATIVLLLVGLADARASTVLAVIGDYGEPGEGATSVANMVGSSNWQTDYVLTLGDNNYGSVAVGHEDWEGILGARYGRFMKSRTGPGANPYPLQTSAVQRFFPAIGNHDIDSQGTIAGYLDYFHADPGAAAGRLPAGVHADTQSYYDFALPIEGGSGSVRVFAMDSESYAASSASRSDQIAWLRDGLKNSTATWNFVTLHRPSFSSSQLHGSDPLMQLPFQQWGAHAVLAGHAHLYERLRVTDATQEEMLYFVNGLGGAATYNFGARAPGSEFRYNESRGAMRVTVTDLEARFEFLGVDVGEDGLNGGALIDSFTLLKSNLPTPPELTADFNDDDFVDDADLLIWRSAFGVSNLADADGDGASGGDDFLAWQSQRSPFRDAASLIVAVPEPAAGSLLELAVGLLAAYRSAITRAKTRFCRVWQ